MNKNNLFKKLFWIVLAVIVISVGLEMATANVALADGIDGTKASEYLDEVVGKVKDPNKKLGIGKREIPEMIGIILYYVLGFLGVICLLLIIGAGVMLVTAGGNEETVTKAKGIIIGAAIGVIVILASYALTSFVVNQIMDKLFAPDRPIIIDDEDEDLNIPGYYCSEVNCSDYWDQSDCLNILDNNGVPCCIWNSSAWNYDLGQPGVCE